MLNKSDDMLGEEMDQSKALAESLQGLHSKFDDLQVHHNTLLSDHEKLSLELLQRNQDLEKLRVSYEDLQRERFTTCSTNQRFSGRICSSMLEVHWT